MITTSLREIFAGDVPRIHDVVIFPDQTRSGLTHSMSGASQVSGNHLVGFNVNGEYFENSVKKRFFDVWVDHFKIENPVLITRRGGSFAIEQGVVPEWFRVTFPLTFHPSFKEESLPKDNEEVLERVREIKIRQVKLDTGAIGSGAYALTLGLWWRVSELNKLLQALEQPVAP